MKYSYFNLINSLKGTLIVPDSEPSVDADKYNSIVNKLNWYNLPKNIEELIKLINHTEEIISKDVYWFNVRQKAEEIYNNFN